MQQPGSSVSAAAAGSALSMAAPGPAKEQSVPSAGTAPRPKLLDQVRQAIRARHYSKRTEKTYVDWTKRFSFFPAKRDQAPGGDGQTEIQAIFHFPFAIYHLSLKCPLLSYSGAQDIVRDE